ncbi:REP-associated tyrosine transposase [Candidatus Ferrigenium straubiae]|jgi:REP element-mobilizing transposase RayT|uniref:REP-associated tyrosine transposase n=1 Tax=Candidatus Ferrigenium straubiae TaxID=2919506 RepID=UPI003F4AB0CD
MDNAAKPHGKDLRKGRISLPEHAYLVTAVTASRKALFASFYTARIAVRCFHDRDIVRQARTLAFVVMPDHIHWLLQLENDGNLSGAVRLYKAKVTSGLGQKVWQRGFHDHALRSDEDVRGVARYIIANSLRSGLAGSVAEYPHWDAVWL